MASGRDKRQEKSLFEFWTLFFSTRLLPDGALVESQLLTLQDVSINTTALAGTGRNHGVKTTGLELTFQSILNLAGSSKSGSLLGLYALALLLLFCGLGLLLASSANGLTVVCLVPLSEGSGVDLDDGGLGEGVGADKFVVGRVEGDDDHADLTGDTLRSPGEVTGVETQTTIFGVSTTGADKVDSLGANTSVGWLTALLESSVDKNCVSIFLYFPQLSILVRAIRTSSCGRWPSSHRWPSACGGNHEKYPCLRLINRTTGIG